MTANDEMITAIRRHRQAHAEAFDYDLKRIVADFQRQERESGVPLVKRPPRRPRIDQLPDPIG